MAEDCLCVGFEFFNGNAPYIANDNAVQNALSRLSNEIAFQNANLGNAVEAVGLAARNKALRDVGQDIPDVNDFIEGSDFLL